MYTIYIEGPPQQFWCIVGSLTPTIDANFRNNCHGLSEISVWALSMTAEVLAVRSFDSSSLAYWNLRWTVLKPYILPQVINSWSRVSKEPNYFRCWARMLSIWIFDYTPHLISTSWPFWEYDCLLKASGFLAVMRCRGNYSYTGMLCISPIWCESNTKLWRQLTHAHEHFHVGIIPMTAHYCFLRCQQQPLTEIQYRIKFKLKFVQILMTHPIYTQKSRNFLSSALV